MPELPEVHTIVSDLNKVLPGLKIQDVWCDLPRLWGVKAGCVKNIIKNPKTLASFKKQIVSKKILSVKRVGKNILISLDKNKTILIHQKMTGHMLYGKWEKTGEGKYPWVATQKGVLKDDLQNRFLHLIFYLSNGKQLSLSDIRKFAKVLICETDKLGELKDIKDIGPDPLEKNFTFKKFKEILKGRKGEVKNVLMKQELISGIGNIYSNDILWEAGVYPFKKLQDLNEKELEKIFKAIKKILKQGVKLRGDSIVDYRDAFGKKGGYQNFHKVYQKEGQKCGKKDGGKIKRIMKNGRSTFFCPVHQK